MREASGERLPAALRIAIGPLPIVAVVLMLVAAGGRTTGAPVLQRRLRQIGCDRFFPTVRAAVAAFEANDLSLGAHGGRLH